ncbi:OLC1v1007870C1 [Oldenlandia corymbosa var. corymbosa]|uniref:OLC1v1007870C1 n=1 Tax=Oldenlandia corymbosa var. corymbosa TaxID=529605 RepID=A0AAV1DMQ2_OLDCO|nr:OLC1v1007870C1 [Oldenlandia corymbosa var. corymbosa]
MDIQSYLQSLPTPSILIISFVLCSWFYYQYSWYDRNAKKNSSIPTNWPLLGMLPAIIQNAHRIHDYGTQVLIESGGTFEFKGPWFTNVDFFVTCDPANIHYIFSKNFPNYPKGPEFRKMFDVLGDGIFNADYELWEIHRKVTLSIFHQPDYQKLLQETVLEKVVNGLLPVLESFSSQGAEFDLQDILQRFTFDCFSRLLLDYDPESLSLELPHIRAQYAFLDAEKAIFRGTSCLRAAGSSKMA